MNWVEEVAKKIIEKYPNLDEYVVASGVSPSGFIHIGNFREIVTTYFIYKELKKLGKKVKFILSFDDFDRFRKVPKNIPNYYEKYIGMPYTSIPSPFNSNKTYAKEMEDRFLEELSRLDIYPQVIYQTNEYKSGRYIEKIKVALQERKKIFDILAKYKTQEFTEKDRDNYYPISLYCKNCGKDSTRILSYKNENIEYECKCGYHHVENINKANNIKLYWKVDWPMRWQEEKVIFEPGGRDHSAENGSYIVSSEIAKTIFNYDAPLYVAYDFIGIKGSNDKMASSTGDVLTLTDLLSVYDKNIILWFYAKNKPSHKFNIALDADVLRYYSEFDRLVKSYFNDDLDKVTSSLMSLTGVTKSYLKNPDFSIIANFLPMVNYNDEVLKILLYKENIDCNNLYFQNRLIRATNWLNKYNNSKIIVLSDFNYDYYENLTEEEKKWLERTLEILKNDFKTTKELQELLYSIVKNENYDIQTIKKKQKRYFQIIYNLILGKDTGPKLGLLLFALDYDTILSKLKPNFKIKTKINQ